MNLKIAPVEYPNQKSDLAKKILRSLPNWFGIESAISNYIDEVKGMETWAAQIDTEEAGFISLHQHNTQSAEIHVMAVLAKYHGHGVGKKLIQVSEESLKKQGFKFLQVKTLSASRPDPYYDKTRQFYLKTGFTPIEEFKTLWDKDNPCLLLIKALI